MTRVEILVQKILIDVDHRGSSFSIAEFQIYSKEKPEFLTRLLDPEKVKSLHFFVEWDEPKPQGQ